MNVLLRRMESWRRERQLGIHTRGMKPTTIPGGVHYGTLPYGTIDALLDALDLTHDDVVADIGCGKGRIVCVAKQRELRAVIGIEADPELADDARRNVERSPGHTRVEI